MLFIFALFPFPAFAYLDPSTGSALMYAIFGLSFAVFYTVKGYFYSLKNFFLKSSKSSVALPDIIFFTEGGQYQNTFIPILQHLDEMGVPYKVFTIDANDGILSNKNAEFIRSGARAFAFLGSISAKIMIMTTPQIDVLQLKRSKKVKHYGHILHSCADLSFYKRYAFDYFDSIFLSGHHQEETARSYEVLRGFGEKLLPKTGLCYFDEMVKAVKPWSGFGSTKTLLIAPSWGENGMFTRYGTDFLKAFIGSEFRVIIRPHPQIAISQREVFEQLQSFTLTASNFEFDAVKTPESSLARADFLLSDFSGIIFDFAFTREMPAFILDYEPSLKGYEAEDLPDRKIWELEAIKEIGILVKAEELNTLPAKIMEIDITHYKKKIISLRESSVYNFGSAGKKTAEEIIRICSTL